ncbi:MAG: DsrE family protein [Pseudomonadota bacterium]
MPKNADPSAPTDTTGPLVIIQRSPLQGYRAQAGIDAALSFAVLGRIPYLLFTGEGVLCLIEQTSKSLGRKSIRKLVDSLPLYDVETVYVDELSLRHWQLEATRLPKFSTIITAEETKLLHSSATSILSY